MDARGARGAQCALGWTLVELLIAVSVAAFLGLIAAPVYTDWIASQKLLNEARHLADSLMLARSEAIKHGYRVNVCKSPDRRQCATQGGWQQGWVLYGDDDRDGDVDAGETIVQVSGPVERDITIDGNRPVKDYVSYTSLGHARMLNGALQMGTFTLCKPGQYALEVVLANTGRVRIDRTKQRCP